MGQREGGTRTTRIEFIRETTRGVTPADPDWLLYSDVTEMAEFDPSQDVFQQRGIGDIDPLSFLPGPETGTFTIMYHMQQWPRTSGGAAQDASFDGIIRNAYNQLDSSHSVLVRQTLAGGVIAGGDRRIYTYCTGCLVETVTIKGDPTEGGPVMVELQYKAEQIRSYMISQPAASGVVTITSTNAADTTQDITIEDDSGTAETLSINGTTPVVGAVSFATLDAIRIDGQMVGDLVVEMAATEVARIYGVTSNANTSGDLGLPLLGSGSRAAAIGTAYEVFVGDTVQFGGTDLADNVNSFEMVIANEILATPRYDVRKLDLTEGGRTISVNADVYGNYESHTSIVRHVTVTPGTVQWTMTNGNIQVTGAVMTEVGNRKYIQEDTVITLSNVFTGAGIAVSNSV